LRRSHLPYARVLEECIDIRFGAMFALFIRHLVCFSLFSKLDRTDHCRRAWQPGNWSSTEIGLNPQSTALVQKQKFRTVNQ